MKSIKRFTKSVTHAARGINYVFFHEQNFRIQLVAGSLVIFFALVLQVKRSEIVVLLLLILLVLILELLNSALEKYLDLMKPRLGFHAGTVKDIMAGMVLVSSVGALVIGFIVFWPYLTDALTLLSF